MSEELAKRIREHILAKGPIPFSHWMGECLYHPQYGYYMKPGRKTGYGRDADFVTPPTLHPFFGSAVGAEVHEAWIEADAPSKYAVLEFGGGEGDLALAAVAWIDANSPGLSVALRWLHQEVSPTHEAVQRLRSKDPRFGWTGDTHDMKADFLLYCEVLDAQTFDVFERGQSGWTKLMVGLEAGRFVEKPGGPLYEATPYQARNGERIAVPTYGGQLHDDLDHLKSGGTVLICDYGGRGPGFLPRPRAFRSHQQVELVGQDPGNYDITMDVDFGDNTADSASLAQAESMHMEWRGLMETRFETMEQFLLRHGILEELNHTDRNSVEGASSYLRLRQLLLPTGMGAAFKVQRLELKASGPAQS